MGEGGYMTRTEWMFNKDLMDEEYGAHFGIKTILHLLSEKVLEFPQLVAYVLIEYEFL